MSRLWQFSGTRSPNGDAASPRPARGPASPGSAPAFVDGLLDPDERQASRYVSRPARPGALLATRVGLWAAVVVGCLSGLVALARSGGADPAPVTDDAAGAEDVPAPVGNVAEMAVEAWLTASQDEAQLDQLFVDPPAAVDIDTQNLSVGAVRAVAGQRIDDGYWTVTVAAEVLDMTPEQLADARARAAEAARADAADALDLVEGDDRSLQPRTWYVEVGIVGDVSHGLAAIATPAVMPAPPAVSDEWARRGDAPRTPDEGDPVVETVQGFLEALLTGAGDPQRYAAPGLEVAPLDPAPFAEVTVVEMALEDLDGGEVRAWTHAQVESRSGTRQVVGYEFVVVPREDRWEIVEFWGSPSVVEGPAPDEPAASAEDESGDGSDEGSGTTSSDDTASDDTASDDTTADEGAGGDGSQGDDAPSGDAPTGEGSPGGGSDDGDRGLLSPEEMPAENPPPSGG